MSAVPYLALISAVAGLALAAFYYKAVEAAPAGNDRMQFLMTEIQKGARAFLKQEYTWVAAFAVCEFGVPHESEVLEVDQLRNGIGEDG